jgi:hypothetical protein
LWFKLFLWVAGMGGNNNIKSFHDALLLFLLLLLSNPELLGSAWNLLKDDFDGDPMLPLRVGMGKNKFKLEDFWNGVRIFRFDDRAKQESLVLWRGTFWESSMAHRLVRLTSRRSRGTTFRVTEGELGVGSAALSTTMLNSVVDVSTPFSAKSCVKNELRLMTM